MEAGSNADDPHSAPFAFALDAAQNSVPPSIGACIRILNSHWSSCSLSLFTSSRPKGLN
jgi:amino acid permease